jgi:hypothetical protein
MVMLRKALLSIAVLVCAVLVCGSAAAGDKKADKKTPALSGVWVQKQGDLTLKIDFSDKEAVKVSLSKGEKAVTLTCKYSRDRKGVVKAEVTEVEEQGVNVKEKLPVGLKFSFKWQVKKDTAALDDVEGDKAPPLLKSHLPGKYKKEE